MSQNSLKEGIGMTDAPEFPQADPAVQYIVRQVAKIEDARACTAGYYKGQTALMRRLEKTDEELAKIHRLLEGLTPEDAARYFREGMDHAIREVEGEVRREIQKAADDAVARLATSARSLEQTATDVERQMERMQKNMAGSEGLLRSAVRQTAGEYADAIRGSEASLQAAARAVTEGFQGIAAAQTDLQARFAALVEKCLYRVPLAYLAGLVGLAFALGFVVRGVV
ncbi:MAG: hypothetical protein WC277_12920 [Bacilli bacterium]